MNNHRVFRELTGIDLVTESVYGLERIYYIRRSLKQFGIRWGTESTVTHDGKHPAFYFTYHYDGQLIYKSGIVTVKETKDIDNELKLAICALQAKEAMASNNHQC